MAVELAHDMCKNPPHLVPNQADSAAPPTQGPGGAPLPPHTGPPLQASLTGTVSKGKKKRVSLASHAITATASTTLAHCAFLCTVLSENPGTSARV